MTILDVDRYRYNRLKLRNADGRVLHSANNGDAIARALLGAGRDELMRAVEDNGVRHRMKSPPESLRTGHLRMIVGNMLRAVVRAGDAVKVGRWDINSLNQDVPVEEIEKHRRT